MEFKKFDDYRLNIICPMGRTSDSGVYYEYEIREAQAFTERENPIGLLRFQKGIRGELGSTQGISDIDLLDIVRHRLLAFKYSGNYSLENQLAIDHVEAALSLLHKRVIDRVERGVLGTDVE